MNESNISEDREPTIAATGMRADPSSAGAHMPSGSSADFSAFAHVRVLFFTQEAYTLIKIKIFAYFSRRVELSQDKIS